MGVVEPNEKPTFEKEVCIQRKSGCDIWVVKDGREFKLWRGGYFPAKDDPFPTDWADEKVTAILQVEAAEQVKEDAIAAEKEPEKIDDLLAYAKANPDECEAALKEIARLKLEAD